MKSKNLYIKEIQSTLRSVLEAEDPSLPSASPGDMGIGGAPPVGDELSLGDSPEGIGGDMMDAGPGSMEPLGQEQGQPEDVLSKSDEDLLSEIPSSTEDVSDGEGDKLETEDGDTKDAGLGDGGNVTKKPEASVMESDSKNSNKRNKKSGTKVYSDIKHVPKGRVASNQVHQEWVDLIDKILRSVNIMSDEMSQDIESNKEEIKKLKEHVRKLEGVLYESLSGIKDIIKEASLYVSRSDISSYVVASTKLGQKEKEYFAKQIRESESQEEIKRIFEEIQIAEKNSREATIVTRPVSPLRLNSTDLDKIQEYRRSTVERQDKTLLGENVSNEKDGGLGLPFSVSRLQEMAGIWKGDNEL